LRLLNASGCLDALTAPEVARTLDVFVTKTVTPLSREGNAPVRIAETEAGMLNAIGLANPGVEAFVAEHLPRLAQLGVPLWVSVGGFSVEDYVHVAAQLGDRDEVEALELNLSCPNVDEVPESARPHARHGPRMRPSSPRRRPGRPFSPFARYALQYERVARAVHRTWHGPVP
jgi:dihydroorotate dehydrogenase